MSMFRNLMGMSEYKPLNYIEVNGTNPTCYIDLGITPHSGQTYEMGLYIDKLRDQPILCEGLTVTPENRRWVVCSLPAQNIDWQINYMGTWKRTGVSVSANTYYVYKAYFANGTQNIWVDGNLIASYTIGGVPNNYNELRLFRLDLASGVAWWHAYCKIYYLKIWQNDSLVGDFIPVLDNNNTPCLYNKVNKTFYYNLGTDDLLYG